MWRCLLEEHELLSMQRTFSFGRLALVPFKKRSFIVMPFTYHYALLANDDFSLTFDIWSKTSSVLNEWQLLVFLLIFGHLHHSSWLFWENMGGLAREWLITLTGCLWSRHSPHSGCNKGCLLIVFIVVQGRQIPETINLLLFILQLSVTVNVFVITDLIQLFVNPVKSCQVTVAVILWENKSVLR